MYKTIQQYIENNKERYKVTIDDIFEVDREGEEQRFRKDIGNNWLLWHGSVKIQIKIILFRNKI